MPQEPSVPEDEEAEGGIGVASAGPARATGTAAPARRMHSSPPPPPPAAAAAAAEDEGAEEGAGTSHGSTLAHEHWQQ